MSSYIINSLCGLRWDQRVGLRVAYILSFQNRKSGGETAIFNRAGPYFAEHFLVFMLIDAPRKLKKLLVGLLGLHSVNMLYRAQQIRVSHCAREK
jgi:hypothetical protein